MSTVYMPDDALRATHTTSRKKNLIYLLLQELKAQNQSTVPIRKNLSLLGKA